ncbi:hypothetical protein FZX01_16075 [Listeria monocytogenes]|uniref:hypothetical protein n=1 Tax=Listeria monocytogenes TaxID=1639 RepID=UPI0011EAC07F|nr:hypothetical protein [Listeria monocytogenes]TYU82207.1 hypothetical protein FZX01_16075 [Listeria monocytogenes]
MIAIEDALKLLFNRWLEEMMPDIKEEVSKEVLGEVSLKSQQILFNQQEMAKRQNVSVTTFKKWRVMGLQAEPSPTGKLLFDLNKVNEWRQENNIMKGL